MIDKNIGGGTFGTVYSFYSQAKDNYIAVKVANYYGASDKEIYIINELEHATKLLKVEDPTCIKTAITSIVPHLSTCIIMEHFDGTLNEFMNDNHKIISVLDKFKIFQQILNVCICLYRECLIYT